MIKILAVDDSPTMHRLFKMIFSEDEYDLKLSDNGEEGIQIAKEFLPDIILLDFIMPKMNGFHFCKMVRSNQQLKDVPILLITSKAEDVGDKFEKKFDNIECIAKPFQPDELIEKIKEALQEKEQQSTQIENIIDNNFETILNNKVSDNKDIEFDSDTVVETTDDAVLSAIPSESQSVIDQIISKIETKVIPTLRDSIKRFITFETGYMISEFKGDLITIEKMKEVMSGSAGELVLFNSKVHYHFLFENGELYAGWCGENKIEGIFELLQDVSGVCLLEVSSLEELYEQVRNLGLSDQYIKKCYQFYIMSLIVDVIDNDELQYYLNEIDIEDEFRTPLKVDVARLIDYYNDYLEEKAEINKVLYDEHLYLEKQNVDNGNLNEFEQKVLNLCNTRYNLGKILSYFGDNRQYVKNVLGMLVLTGYVNIIRGQK
jgi:DNA-binding response OmpR family regulator